MLYPEVWVNSAAIFRICKIDPGRSDPLSIRKYSIFQLFPIDEAGIARKEILMMVVMMGLNLNIQKRE